MDYYKQIKDHVENNDLPSALNLWQEYCLSDEVNPVEFEAILKLFKNSTHAKQFGCYVEEGLAIWKMVDDPSHCHEILKLIFDLQTTNEPHLAALATEYLSQKFSEQTHFQQKLRLIGLRDLGDFQHCISNFDLLNHMEVGNCFFHTAGWGCGELLDVSLLREQVSLDFDYVGGVRELSFANAFKTLEPIPATHFLARRFCQPDALEEEARKNPVEVLRLLLKDLGPLTAADIKEEICDLVIPEKDWAKWWQMARSKAKKDTLIDTPDTLRHPFKLREEALTHEDRLQELLSKNPPVPELIEIIYAFLRDFSSALKNKEFKATLKKHLEDVMENQHLSAAEELQLLFFLSDLCESSEAPRICDVVARFQNIGEIMDGIHIVSFKKRFLMEIRAAKDNWDELFLAFFLKIDYNTIRDYILAELLKAKKEKELTQKIAQLIEDPAYYPNAFLWYFQKIMSDKALPYASDEGKCELLEGFFTLLYQLEQKGDHRDFVKKMIAFMTQDRYANIRNVFQKASKSVLQEVLLLATKCSTLTDHDITILHSLAEVVHASLATLRKHDEQEAEDILWTTDEGYKRVKSRAEEISTVETVENAKEIELARSHGDLRENSEFKFALEKRDRLQAELHALSEQLSKMRIINAEDIDTSKVSVGTYVTLEKPDGSKLSFTILGSEEADPDKGILSFQSRLARSIIGLRVGETCTIHDEEMVVKSIESYLDRG